MVGRIHLRDGRLREMLGEMLEEMLEPGRMGEAIRYLGLVLLVLAAGASSLTFNWVIDHNPEANFFPEFAGRVVYLSDIPLALGVALWALGRRLGPPQGLKYGPWYVALPVLLLSAITVMSVVWAGDAAQAGFAALRRVFLVGLYLALVNESNRVSTLMFLALVVAGGLHSGVALAQLATGSAVGATLLGELTQGALGHDVVGDSRAYGLGFNPNPVGMFLAVVSLAGYGWFLVKEAGWPVRGLGLAAFLFAGAGLAATASRSALLGWALGTLAVTLATWLWSGQSRRRTLGLAGSAGLLVFLSLALFSLLQAAAGDAEGPAASGGIFRSLGNVSQRFRSGQVSDGVDARSRDLKLALPVIREHPWLGVGAGNYPQSLKERISPQSFGGVFTPPHNVLLLVAAELGVAGLASWALLLAAPLIWRLTRRRCRGVSFPALLWVGPVIVLLFESLWDFPPWATQDGRVLTMAVLGLWAGGVESAGSASPAPGGTTLDPLGPQDSPPRP